MRRLGIREVRLGSWGIVGATAALLLFGGACEDALSLPSATSGSGTGTSTGGSGGSGGGGGSGGAPVSCQSNADCPAPTAICDTVRDECVECLDIGDCSFRPGTVCSKGACACPKSGESFCGEPARCVDLTSSSQDCGACGHACFGACTTSKCADAWEPTSLKNAPTPRRQHVAVWTMATNKMIVWSGQTGADNTNTGGILDFATGVWTPTSTSNVPGPRKGARAVWTGMYMVVWGGANGATDSSLNTGGVFNPATNTWITMSSTGAPSARYGHAMVWSGSKVLVWGGFDGTNYLGDGAAYDVIEDKWEALPAMGTPPTARADHSAVWANDKMIVFGGYGFNGTEFNYLGDGFELDLAAGMWAPVKDGQPSPRSRHTVEWTGTEMIIWGGRDANGLSPSGARYKPGIDWSVMTTDGAPELREFHTAVWISPRLVIWGGLNAGGGYINSGALYDPSTNTWSSKQIPTAPIGRAYHTAVNANGKMVIWGGATPEGLTNTGGVLDPAVLP